MRVIRLYYYDLLSDLTDVRLFMSNDITEGENFLFVIKNCIKNKKCESRYFFTHSLHSMDIIFKPQYYFFQFQLPVMNEQESGRIQTPWKRGKICQPAENYPQFLDHFGRSLITLLSDLV